MNIPTWKPTTPRATVPTSSMHTSRDVLAPSPIHSSYSPYPLGLGIYAIPQDPSSAPRLLPLHYVSPRVAADRNTRSNCVQPGWYVIAEPNAFFKVAVTVVNLTFPGRDSECRIHTCLHLDGRNCYDCITFLKENSVGTQSTRDCFLTSCRGKSYTRSMEGRRFQFGETEAVEDETGAPKENVGTVRLTCFYAKQADREPVNVNHRTRMGFDDSERQVSEKHQIKHGQSLVARPSGERVVRHSRLPRYKSVERRLVPEAGILIRVREEAWMKRQKLIDDEGQPCTHEMFRAMVAAEKSARNGMKRESPVEVPDGVAGSSANTVKREQEITRGTLEELSTGSEGRGVSMQSDVIDEIIKFCEPNEPANEDAIDSGEWRGNDVNVQALNDLGSSQRVGRTQRLKREAGVIEIADMDASVRTPRKKARTNTGTTAVIHIDEAPLMPRRRQSRSCIREIVDLTVDD
eukprot:GFKZ01011317.1.p1 GENE.GFKZ01011317.1~~GFKZ01011317.1.p1  ORF type:complete len:462 (-),score=53.21 GFKZ01011317.1:557-1942(-)